MDVTDTTEAAEAAEAAGNADAGAVMLISDPRVQGVEVRECAEPLVDLRGALRVDGRRGDPRGDYALTREGVRDRLVQADRALPAGVSLLIIEAYRPASLQTHIFDGYRNTLQAADPGLSLAEAERLASRYVAPLSTAPHVCGAAIDLTLVDASGEELDLGCPEGATPEESDGACYTASPRISARARENRAMLAEALGSAGMVNYATEWWHWSYGDRYWAQLTGSPYAVYGPPVR
ncbi:MAG TPA: M15 family metallopeptidase [Actinospica sp.]|jgi:D-alanyl-D-alanine dipeptidase|nr:M15 family metallopeptidase [Actinospica sp.]